MSKYKKLESFLKNHHDTVDLVIMLVVGIVLFNIATAIGNYVTEYEAEQRRKKEIKIYRQVFEQDLKNKLVEIGVPLDKIKENFIEDTEEKKK